MTLKRVHGELLRWARVEQEMSLGEVQQRGGPSKSYQCEVEKGLKSETTPDVLKRWVEILHVTMDFARGEIPCYHEDPVRCRGLAADIVPVVESDRDRLAGLEAGERIAYILSLVARRSQRLPRGVLAWVLGVSLRALDDMMLGRFPVPPDQVTALSEITTIPRVFLVEGKGVIAGAPLEEFLPAINLARSAGMNGADLYKLIKSHVSLTDRSENAVRIKAQN